MVERYSQKTPPTGVPVVGGDSGKVKVSPLPSHDFTTSEVHLVNWKDRHWAVTNMKWLIS
jgi:hypothetical protein